MATVLVVDDDRVLSHLVASLLRGKGHKVFNAFDAVQGLMLAMRSPLQYSWPRRNADQLVVA